MSCHDCHRYGWRQGFIKKQLKRQGDEKSVLWNGYVTAMAIADDEHIGYARPIARKDELPGCDTNQQQRNINQSVGWYAN